MKGLLQQIKQSGFLSRNEILKLKVTLVMFFLLVFGGLTVPVSFLEEFSLGIKILVPLTFTFLFSVGFLLLFFNKTRLAMHVSVYTFLGLTYYYVAGSGQLYGYFLLFITLSVIIFYQDITTYLIYGGAVTIFGIFYLGAISDTLIAIEGTALQVPAFIYQMILLGFFLVFLVHFILKDSIEEELNKDYLESEGLIQRYNGYALSYIRDYEDREGQTPPYEDTFFQNMVVKLSEYIHQNWAMADVAVDMDEAAEFYFFLHHHNLETIMEKEYLSSTVKRYAQQFDKFKLNKNEDMNTVLMHAASYFKTSYKNSFRRYEYHLGGMFTNRTNRIIALGLIYKYLRTEVTQFDKWGRVDKVLSHQEIKQLFKSKPMRKFITYEDMNFFLENESVFKQQLS